MAGIRRDVRSQSAADCGTFPATRRQARCTPRPRLRHRGTMPGRFGICFADEHLVFFRVSFYTALRSGRPFPPSRTSFANPSPPGIPFSRRDWCRDTAKFGIPEAGMTMACSGVAGKSCSGTANIRKIRRTSFLRINGMAFFRMMPRTEYGLQTLGGRSGSGNGHSAGGAASASRRTAGASALSTAFVGDRSTLRIVGPRRVFQSSRETVPVLSTHPPAAGNQKSKHSEQYYANPLSCCWEKNRIFARICFYDKPINNSQ